MKEISEIPDFSTKSGIFDLFETYVSGMHCLGVKIPSCWGAKNEISEIPDFAKNPGFHWKIWGFRDFILCASARGFFIPKQCNPDMYFLKRSKIPDFSKNLGLPRFQSLCLRKRKFLSLYNAAQTHTFRKGRKSRIFEKYGIPEISFIVPQQEGIFIPKQCSPDTYFSKRSKIPDFLKNLGFPIFHS